MELIQLGISRIINRKEKLTAQWYLSWAVKKYSD